MRILQCLMASRCALLFIVFVVVPFADIVNGEGDVADSPKKTKVWTLYHRLLSPGAASDTGSTGTTEWSVRGKVELTVDTGTPSSAEAAKLEIANEADSLPESFAKALASSSSKNAWYQLKLVHGNDATAAAATQKEVVLASVPACNVRRANFRDEFLLQLQQGTAHALSLTYMPLVSPLAPPSCADYTSLPESTNLQFESKISFDTAIPGMVVGKPPPKDGPIVTSPKGSKSGAAAAGAQNMPPPGLKWIPGGAASRKKGGAGGGGGGGNGSPFAPPEAPQEAGMFGFFKRYWYYILPLMFIQLMGSPEAPPQGGGAAAAPGTAPAAASGGNAAQGAPSPSRAAAAAKNTTGNQPQQPARRRGKKE